MDPNLCQHLTASPAPTLGQTATAENATQKQEMPAQQEKTEELNMTEGQGDTEKPDATAGQKAKDKLIDLISRRDHTEKELIKKLRLRKHAEPEIKSALDWAKKRGYLKSTEQMSALLDENLKRQLKGERLRAHELAQKGAKLPPVDPDEELKLAKLWIQKKQPPKEKIRQRLQMRGYTAQTIQKLMKQTGDDHIEES